MVENLPGEIWKDIPGFEKYRVSNMGRVGSLMRCVGAGKWEQKNIIQRILKGHIKQNGYRFVILMQEKKRINKHIHSLVMLAFVGIPRNDQEVCHNDGNSVNNQLVNLRYDTHANNMRDALAYNGGVYRNASITKNDVIKIRGMAQKGISYSEISKLLCIGVAVVREAGKGRSYTHIVEVLPVQSPVRNKQRARNAKIIAERKRGVTLIHLAKKYGLSKSGISLICSGKRGNIHKK